MLIRFNEPLSKFRIFPLCIPKLKSDKYAETFLARRHDFEQNYTLVVQMPRFEFYGMTPNLTYRYNHNKSNVDWLYSYDKHNISLKLEHRF